MSDEKLNTDQRVKAAMRNRRGQVTADEIKAIAAIGAPESDLALFDLLAHHSSRVRILALDCLKDRDRSLARVAAHAAISDSDGNIRLEAAKILKEIGTESDRVRLITALTHDKEWLVRAHAADALAFRKGGTVTNALLLTMCDDPVPIVRRDAAHALANHEPSAVIPALEQALAKEKAEQARVGILTSLYTLGQRNRLPDLLALWRSPDHQVRYAVLNSLWDAVAEEDKPAMIAALEALLATEESPGLRSDAAKALTELRETETKQAGTAIS